MSSPGVHDSYNTYRNGRLPTQRQYALSVDAQAKKEIAEQLAGFEQMRLAAEKMAPKDRDMLMEQVKQALANLTNPAYADKLRAQLTAERAQESGQGIRDVPSKSKRRRRPIHGSCSHGDCESS